MAGEGHSAPALSVVVPAFAEGPSIRRALTGLVAALDASDGSYEVIVVSDGSTDDTVAEAGRVDQRVRVVHYDVNRGKGHALRRGFAETRADVVAFMDADLDLDPRWLAGLRLLLQSSAADVVVGSKIHPDSEVVYPPFRRFQSEVYRRIVRALFRLDLGDTQTGMKVFRRAVLDDVVPHARSDGFAFDLELLTLVNDAGYRLVEGPVRLDYQFSTTTGARAVVDVMADTLRIAARRTRRLRSPEWKARAAAIRVG